MGSVLEDLIASTVAEPFPTEERWREYVEHVAETLDVGPGTSIFDIACGSGAFLYPLWENGYVVGGADALAANVERARGAMRDGRFEVQAPDTINPAVSWDVVVARGVFDGDTHRDRTRGLLARVAAKATHAVALLDVPHAVDRSLILKWLVELGASGVRFVESPLSQHETHARVDVFARIGQP